jgi:hypothetical protein
MKFNLELHPTSKQVILITMISSILAGAFYFIRVNYLQLSTLEHNLFRAIRMTLVYVLLPIGWAIVIKKFNWRDLGITKKSIITSTILGLGVYSIALLAFLITLGNPDFDNHFRWGMDFSIAEWLLIMSLVCWMAFVTDLFTRGFVLMLLAKFQTPWFAILVQNLVWLGVHVYEILILVPSMTIAGAIVLTITLGVLGDIVALKTKNIIGLGVGHMFLNVAFFSYVRILG